MAVAVYKEQREEKNIIKFFRDGEKIFIDLIQNGENLIIKDCATRLYQIQLKLFDDFYGVYYGRKREVWGKHLEKHILTLRRTIVYIRSLGSLLATLTTDVPSYIFAINPIEDEAVTFPNIMFLIYSLLFDLQTYYALYGF
jgi:hypothetical protein